jgi:hypothetical protein
MPGSAVSPRREKDAALLSALSPPRQRLLQPAGGARRAIPTILAGFCRDLFCGMAELRP